MISELLLFLVYEQLVDTYLSPLMTFIHKPAALQTTFISLRLSSFLFVTNGDINQIHSVSFIGGS